MRIPSADVHTSRTREIRLSVLPVCQVISPSGNPSPSESPDLPGVAEAHSQDRPSRRRRGHVLRSRNGIFWVWSLTMVPGAGIARCSQQSHSVLKWQRDPTKILGRSGVPRSKSGSRDDLESRQVKKIATHHFASAFEGRASGKVSNAAG